MVEVWKQISLGRYGDPGGNERPGGGKQPNRQVGGLCRSRDGHVDQRAIQGTGQYQRYGDSGGIP